MIFDFNWALLPGGGNFDPGVARPARSADGAWDYTNDSETLGEGNTFAKAKGIPLVVVDNVPRTGGGVTVSNDFDKQYTGNDYIAIPVGHGRNRSIAHELGHVAGILAHPATGVMGTDGTSTTSVAYCSAMRRLATK